MLVHCLFQKAKGFWPMTRISQLLCVWLLFSCAMFGQTVYFTYQMGGPLPAAQYYTFADQYTYPYPPLQNLTVGTSGQSWISASLVNPAYGPAVLIRVNPVGLAPGGYVGSVNVYSSNPMSFGVTVILSVKGPPPVNAYPSALVFNAVQGSSPPAPQLLTVNDSYWGAPIYSLLPTPLPAWLNVSLYSGNVTYPWYWVGNTPFTLQVAISPGFASLGPGTYTTALHFSTTMYGTDDVAVPITLVVAGTPSVLKASPTQINVSYTTGQPMLPAFDVQVTSSGNPLAASVSTNVPWLHTSSPIGTTPFTASFSVDLTALNPGTYAGQILISTTPFNSNPSSQLVAVTLTLTANNLPAIDSVLNAASHKPTIAPGAWISIMGKNFSPDTVQATTQWLSTTLNGVSVQMSGTGAMYDLLVHYVSPTQINAFVPFEVSPYMYGPQGAKLTVTTAAGTASSTVDCEAIAPALFSWGTDNYATGTLSNGMMIGDDPGMSPASVGSMITVYGTGFGQTNPNSQAVNGPMLPHPLAAQVTATIGGVPAEVSWAGMIGMGLYQFNLKVPELPGLPGTQSYPIVLSIAGADSPTVMLPYKIGN
jgi:uncharacterized protein (TIGR03437 family)